MSKSSLSMRWILGPIFVALLAPSALAQEGEEPPEEGAEESEAAPDMPEPGGEAPTTAETAGKADAAMPQVSETHVVAGGDTLWDLCTKYLNSPWYWPKIWSYNPQITNPHWIYPGNELRFYPSDENMPTQVSASMVLDEPTQEQSGPSVERLDPEDLVKTVGQVQVGRLPTDSVYMSHMTFVTQKEHQVAGEITNSFSESQMLSDFDQAYVKLKSAAKKGEPYTVYRTVKEIEHPITGEPFGFVVEVLGTVSVIDTSPTVATVQVNQAYRPIERGDFVGPLPESANKRVVPSPGTTDAKGYIIETMEAAATTIGEHHVVFIDVGRQDGVQLGNLFSVYSRGDRFTRETEGLPNEEMGRLMVIDVQEKSSTAMVIRSVYEFGVGDKIEMKKSI